VCADEAHSTGVRWRFANARPEPDLRYLIEVRSGTKVVSRWIAVASQDIDEPSADALHMNRRGIFRASKKSEEF
jgi:hypothetical protein